MTLTESPLAIIVNENSSIPSPENEQNTIYYRDAAIPSLLNVALAIADINHPLHKVLTRSLPPDGLNKAEGAKARVFLETQIAMAVTAIHKVQYKEEESMANPRQTRTQAEQLISCLRNLIKAGEFNPDDLLQIVTGEYPEIDIVSSENPSATRLRGIFITKVENLIPDLHTRDKKLTDSISQRPARPLQLPKTAVIPTTVIASGLLAGCTAGYIYSELSSIKETAEVRMLQICYPSTISNNPNICDDFDLLNPGNVDRAIQSMERSQAYLLDSDTLRQWANTREVVLRALEVGKTVYYISGQGSREIPAIDITEQPIDSQIDIAKNLANSAIEDRRMLVYDIGNHPLSPADAAVGLGNNVTVIGLNPEPKPLEDVIRGTENIKLPKEGSGSLGLNTRLTAEDAGKYLPRANQAQAFAPYPSDVGKMVNLGCRIADNTFVVINPSSVFEYPPESALGEIPSNCTAMVEKMTRKEIEKILGTSLSAFLGGYGDNDKIPVIVAHSK